MYCVRGRYAFGELTPALARVVVFTGGRELGVGATMDLVSPALSANVLRLGSGSLTMSYQYAERYSVFVPRTWLAQLVLKIRCCRQP